MYVRFCFWAMQPKAKDNLSAKLLFHGWTAVERSALRGLVLQEWHSSTSLDFNNLCYQFEMIHTEISSWLIVSLQVEFWGWNYLDTWCTETVTGSDRSDGVSCKRFSTEILCISWLMFLVNWGHLHQRQAWFQVEDPSQVTVTRSLQSIVETIT